MDSGPTTVDKAGPADPPAAPNPAAGSETDPNKLPIVYHPLSGYPKPGYLGALSDDQSRALALVRDVLLAKGHGEALRRAATIPAETVDGMLLRFLRAKAFDSPASLAMVEEHLAWRAEHGVDSILDERPEDILGCDPRIIRHYLPTLSEGVDRQGRPLQWGKQGAMKMDEILKHTTRAKLLRGHIWEQENLMRRFRESAQERGCLVCHAVTITDFAHFSPGLASREALGLMRDMAAMDAAHYPDRQGRIILINAGFVVAGLWQAVHGFVGKDVLERVQVYNDRSKWEPVLQELIAPDQIPEEFGGTRPVRLRDLSKDEPLQL